MRGFVFEKFAEPNPFGTWAKMMTFELGIKQDYLASQLDGTARNAVAMMFQSDRQGPSFATPAGGVIIDEIIAEEKRQWQHLWRRNALKSVTRPGTSKGAPRYPASRPRILRQAAFALSIWNVPGDDLRERNREFFELLPMLSREVYEQMVYMLGEPYYGMVMEPGRRKPRKEMEGPTRSPSTIIPYNWRSGRRGAVVSLAQAEDHSLRDKIFDEEFDKLVAAGHRSKAFERAVTRFDAHQEAQTEADLKLIESA